MFVELKTTRKGFTNTFPKFPGTNAYKCNPPLSKCTQSTRPPTDWRCLRVHHPMCLLAASANCSCWRRSSSSNVMPLCSNLFAFFSRPYHWASACLHKKGNPKVSHLLDFLVLCSGFQNGRDVVGKAELLQCLGDVVTSDSLFGFLLRNLVCLARDESDELDTALYKEVAGLLGEGDAC